MPTYRLQPSATRSWWWALFGVTAIIILIPAVLNLLVPSQEREEEVVLSTAGYSWEIPLDITCDPAPLTSMGSGWQCGGVILQSIIAEGGTDSELTLRRMMRALNFTFPPENIPILKEGDMRMLIDDRTSTVGLSLEGTGDQEGQTMVSVITGQGPQVATLSDQVWQSYSGGQELPEVVMEAIAELGVRGGPGGSDDAGTLPRSVSV